MEDLDSIVHRAFKYIFIPADIDLPIEERSFEGMESDFKESMKKHFRSKPLKDSQGLLSSISEQSKGVASADQLQAAMMTAGSTYQIVPLTLPCKKTNYEGINAYVDDVGQYKDYGINSRATRILSSECRGDCFLSKTFDDENDFIRKDLPIKEYEALLAAPPNPQGRFDPAMAFSAQQGKLDVTQMMAELQKKKEHSENVMNRCNNCYKEKKEGVKMFVCGNCKSVVYCDGVCQKNDWRYHKQSCKKQ